MGDTRGVPTADQTEIPMPSPLARHRRKVAKTLADVKREIGLMQWRWRSEGHVYVPREERETTGFDGYRRDRRPDEYPEADPAEWGRLVVQLDDMIGTLSELRLHAYTQYYDRMFGPAGKPRS
jgi:hypothetical protein